jgi:catechol 2,3-dioxygenase-like lactoylglutathione lyase family enzyme
MKGLLFLAALACARPLPVAAGGAVEPAARVFGIARVKLRVADLGKTRDFYRDFLGLPWREDPPSSATVAINARQLVELEVGPAGPDGQLVEVAFAASTDASLRDPDQHAIVLEQPRASPLVRPAGTSIATHIAHVGVIAGRLGPSLAFYHRLRFEETWRGSADGRSLSWVNLRVPDGDQYLELMLYDQRPPPEQLGGKHHLCLSTPDVASAVAVLERRRGGYTRPIEIKVGRNGKRQANLFDPDGTRVELMEPVTADGRPVPPSGARPPHP